jgi:DNA-binding IclR family transcriptional regulator
MSMQTQQVPIESLARTAPFGASRTGVEAGTDERFAVRGAPSRPVVAPFARALSLLAAFTPQDHWLGTCELAARSGLPPSTVTRMAQTLVILGYMQHSSARRRYRLAAPVLALGYAAIANSDVQRGARAWMKLFAEQHGVQVNLSSRDRLDLVVVENVSCAPSPLALNLRAGVRLEMVASPIGWALLAALPELERYYLLEHVERRKPREWPRLRRLSSEGISQVQQRGFCHAGGEWSHEQAIVASPVLIPGQAPMVVACVGTGSQLTRSRVEREFGPRLRALATSIEESAVTQ